MLLEPSDDWSCSGRVCSGGGSGLRIIGVGDDCGWRRPAFSFPERLVVGWLGASFKGFFLRLKATMATRARLGYYAEMCRLRRAAADSAMTNGQDWQHSCRWLQYWIPMNMNYLLCLPPNRDGWAYIERSLVHLGLGSIQKCCTEDCIFLWIPKHSQKGRRERCSSLRGLLRNFLFPPGWVRRRQSSFPKKCISFI